MRIHCSKKYRLLIHFYKYSEQEYTLELLGFWTLSIVCYS
jgi:hypothetical protein